MKDLWRTTLAIFLLVQSGMAADPCHTCELNGNPLNCPIGDLPRGCPSQIFPGGDTKCGYTELHDPVTNDMVANPYFFSVVRGLPLLDSKLVIHFQGGGVCDGIISDSYVPTLPCNDPIIATPKPSVQDEGIMENTNFKNPFFGWTIVNVGYCTGDVGVGATVDLSGTWNFNGYENVKAVLDWVEENIPNPRKIAFTGESGGTFTLMLYLNKLLADYNQRRSLRGGSDSTIATVVLDEGVGLVPSEKSIGLLGLWGACSLDFVECNDPWSLETLQLAAQAAHREVPFLYTNHKYDPFYLFFFAILRENPSLTQERLYDLAKSALLTMTQEGGVNNVITHYFNGPGHTTIQGDRLYDEEENGTKELRRLMRRLGNRVDWGPRWTRSVEAYCLDGGNDPEPCTLLAGCGSNGSYADYTCDPDLLDATFEWP